MKQKLLNFALLSIIVSAILSIAAALSFFFILRKDVTLELLGEPEVSLEYGDNYLDEGARASSRDLDLSKRIRISSDLDEQKLGIFHITYDLTFLGKSFETSRAITVKDTKSPEISLKGKSKVEVYIGDKFKDEGATATDNYDGDLTAKIVTTGSVNTKKAGTYELTYSVEDSSKNSQTAVRTVTVKKKPASYGTSVSVTGKVTASDITNYIKKKGYNVAVGYYNLKTSKTYYYRENTKFYGASLIKTLDADYLYGTGAINGSLRYLKPYLQKAITYSDNPSHELIVNRIGKSTLGSYGKSLGAPNSLNRSDLCCYSDTTIKDQFAYLKKLYSLSLKNSDLRSMFINNNNNYLKVNGITTMHKHGAYGSYLHDAGIVLDRGPYIVVILTNHGSGGPAVIRDLSALIYRFHKS